jgi:hypothetical protein
VPALPGRAAVNEKKRQRAGTKSNLFPASDSSLRKRGRGAETGAGASNIHVSQSPRQKAAINSAKRGAEVDEVAAQKKNSSYRGRVKF